MPRMKPSLSLQAARTWVAARLSAVDDIEWRTLRVAFGWLVGVAAITLLLSFNFVDVMAGWGRAVHLTLCALLIVAFAIAPFLLWRVEQDASEPTPLLRVARGIAALAAVLTPLLLLESLARAYPIYDSLAVNPGTHFMWPEFYWPRNDLGFSDRAVGERTGPRILALGDSYTEGAGVRRSERYSNVLETLYRESTDPSLEVFNGGHCGMDTHDEAEVLIETGDEVNPDAIVIAYVLNDADGQGWRPVHGAKQRPLHRFFLRKLGSYAFYRMVVQFKRAPSEAIEDQVLVQHAPDSPGWALVLESFDRIAAWSEARDVPVILVAVPLFASGAEQYDGVLDQVVEAASARGFTARNLLDDFEGDLTPLSVSRWDSHPGAEAHERIAEILVELIGRPWAQRSTAAISGGDRIVADPTGDRSRVKE